MSVQNELEKIEQKVSTMPESETKRKFLTRVNEKLARYDGKDQVVCSAEIVSQLKDKPLPEPIPTNHKSLDNIIRGFYPGQHIVFSAPPKSGKTSFILDLIDRMKSSNPTFIAMEQPAEELVSMMLERELEVPHFITPRYNQEETMDWITQRVTESVIKYDTKVVFLDHFGYIKPSGNFYTLQLQIKDTLHRIKRLAVELDVAIVSIVHIRKINPTEIPTVDDILDSAGFHQEADTIVMLWREAYIENKETKWSNKVLCSVQANRRNGDTGSFRMKYENYRFIEDPNIHFEHENYDPDEY